jgi:UDPglucose--hexose-1-phosphate uridylyltransferase
VIRRNPITGDPILFAPHRAERPNVFHESTVCPFCAGNEAHTPLELAHIGEPWRIRVFPNKYPATDGHEVIVESPQHGATFDSLTPDAATDAVQMYAARYRAHDDACVTIFKNHGSAAGASIPHMHSQLIATPFVPPRIAREIDAFTRAERCPLCDPIGDAIDETSHFRWVAPHASSFSYEQWIVPRVHANELTSDHAGELASLLQRASAAMLGAGDAFNWIFMNFRDAPAAHWYVQIFSRQAVIAGFEIGSGSAIEVIDPSAVAERFRDQRRQ